MYRTQNELISQAYEHEGIYMSASDFKPPWQNVMVEMHSPPLPLSTRAVVSRPIEYSPKATLESHNPSLHPSHQTSASSCVSHDATNHDIYGSNVFITVRSSDTNIDAKQLEPDELEKQAPIASLDIELHTPTSSSSSPNANISTADIVFAL
ncbi:unnamed protein product [Thelazia callipaeda]|uniref:IRF tryptophan pentad repeat domain-containing protein n=1 Tax=Thelazia callipaeda TaxID=103827 RepID=A0A0N5CMT8_THECL|nr:unnamed protein product [Thelazia callipaeda]